MCQRTTFSVVFFCKRTKVNKKGKAPNAQITTSGSCLKNFILYAIRNERIEKNPFRYYKMKVDKTNVKIPLTKEELDTLIRKRMPNDSVPLLEYPISLKCVWSCTIYRQHLLAVSLPLSRLSACGRPRQANRARRIPRLAIEGLTFRMHVHLLILRLSDQRFSLLLQQQTNRISVDKVPMSAAPFCMMPKTDTFVAAIDPSLCSESSIFSAAG